ncbi:type II secretion system F family protein [Botrimarina mediterranea]|uniref:Bacterial type II secretion system protein F domain protein n=1 Tax=Botrimarina mediterranea TaxID=2528022 RepID=A0A518KCS3_9BACT|nr:type II secretion system F family protein [Botrimarina mediterranea]QDV75602.1 Bacterial type II secretion system protein F domain protein [Botrimarina mediterranea]QDV80236.1 Bacterial type II secretion system protein F domain protein [Planctomycetes bacterium K2D]
MTSLAPYLPFVAFAVVSAIIYALFAYFDPYWVSVRGRLDQFDNAKDSPKRRLAGGSNKTAPTSGWFTLPTVSLFRGGDRSHLTQRLAYAGVYQPQAVARYFSISLLTLSAPMLICLTLTLAGLLRWDYAMLFACIGGLTGALAPRLWLDRAIKKRHLQFRRSLPDFLDLMTVCLEGGLSLQETIRRVSDELQLAHSALAAELAVVQRDVELGATVDQALKRFAARSGYEGVRSLSTFIREAQRFGTNVTEALRSHSDMLRSQREQAAEENAQKAAVKILLPTMLLIFPAILIVAVGPAVIQIQASFTASK